MRASTGFALVIGLLTATAPAFGAGLFRAYVSSKGNDGNPCTIAAPCRLLPAALNAVADGGEIWMLDSANYNTAKVTIGKSVSILAVPGVVGSVVSTNAESAVEVNGAGIAVSLRNLEIKPLFSGNVGIDFMAGGDLYVEGCRISNQTTAGIRVTAPNAKATVKNTVLRHNGWGLGVIGTATAALDGGLAEANFVGALASGGARLTVTNATVTNNTYGVYSWAFVEGETTSVLVTHSTMSGNADALTVNAQFGASATIVSDANVLTFVTGTVYSFSNGGATETIHTRQNNTTGYYGTLITPGKNLTPLGPT